MADGPSENHQGPSESHVKVSDLSVDAQVFVPQQAQIGDLYDPLLDTSQWLDYLFNDPEELPNVVRGLGEILSMYLDVKASLETIVDNLLKKCVERDNVQYIAAQCFSFLCQNLKQGEKEFVFRDVFIRRCNQKHGEFLLMQHYDEGITNFTLMICELSLAFRTASGDPFVPLLSAVVDLLNILLDFSTDSTIRCLQKVLKIAGSTIDNSLKDQFSKLFAKMKEKTVTDDVPKHCRKILLDLLILRLSGWQANDPCPPSCASIVPEHFAGIDLNSANGEEISDIYYGDTLIKSDSEHYLIPNEDAEPEIYEDYEKFVSENESGMDASVQLYYEKFLEDLEKKKAS